MITPPKEEFYILPLGEYRGEKGLDHIATTVYGKKYNAIAALEVKSNDVFEVYDLRSKDDCLEITEEHYKPLERWLSLNVGDDISQPWHDEPEIAKYQRDVDEQAPDPSYVIADLILKGHLPYGRYLVEVSW